MNNEDKLLSKELGFDQLVEAAQIEQIAHFYETLEMRVAIALEDLLTDAQLEEFDKLSESKSDDELELWFQDAIPNYESVVSEQTDNLKTEIKNRAEKIKSSIDKTK